MRLWVGKGTLRIDIIGSVEWRASSDSGWYSLDENRFCYSTCEFAFYVFDRYGSVYLVLKGRMLHRNVGLEFVRSITKLGSVPIQPIDKYDRVFLSRMFSVVNDDFKKIDSSLKYFDQAFYVYDRYSSVYPVLKGRMLHKNFELSYLRS